jgi:hypothetical protein
VSKSVGLGPGEHQMAAKQLYEGAVEVSQIKYFEKSTKPEFFDVHPITLFRKIVLRTEFFDAHPSDVLVLSAEMESSNQVIRVLIRDDTSRPGFLVFIVD